MKFLGKCCGPKCYLCYMVISVWAVIQLTCMGAFFWVHAVALLEDSIDAHHDFGTAKNFYQTADVGYRQSAINCFVAVGLYVVTFAVSGVLFFRRTYSRGKKDAVKKVQLDSVEGRDA